MGNTPNVRFKGFTEDWEQRKLGNIATFINGRAYSQDELLSSGKYKVLRVGNFYTNDSWYYSDMELDDKYYAEEGDLLYTWSATFGPHIWHGDKVIYHYHIWKVELSDALEKNFAVQLMEKDKQSILSDKNGSTMVHITKSGMESKEVILPSNIKEQAKIGEYFYSLDNLITLHQQKCDETKEFKKYMLQNMFPQKDEKVPKIRFDGFTGDWEQRKLSDISDVRDGTHDSPKYLNTGHPFVTSKNVKDGFINYDEIQYISDEDFNEINKRSKVDVNDILMGMIGTIGNMALIRTEPDFAIKNVALIKDTKQINHLYLYHFLHSSFIEKQLSFGVDGGTQKFVSLGNIRNLDIVYPSEAEQIKLGDYFEQLDNLITLHQQKCNALKEFKKYMLQNMFPQKGENKCQN